MKIILIIVFGCVFGSIKAQDTLHDSEWKFLNRYGLSTYIFGFFDNAQSAFFGGNELQINLISYRRKRNELSISTGMFFINRSPGKKTNPHMQYFYFPLNISYRLYSKNKEIYWQFDVGKPLLMYEDSKYFNRNDLWPRYETATSSPDYTSKEINLIHSVRFGFQYNKHVSMNIGEMSYLYSSNSHGIKNLTRISFGLEFKL